MKIIRFQICAKLPYLLKKETIGNQIIEVDIEGLGEKEAWQKIMDQARKQIFNDAEIYAEEVGPNELVNHDLFTSKNESNKSITFIKG